MGWTFLKAIGLSRLHLFVPILALSTITFHVQNSQRTYLPHKGKIAILCLIILRIFSDVPSTFADDNSMGDLADSSFIGTINENSPTAFSSRAPTPFEEQMNEVVIYKI
jgi:hypothetical protein